MKKMSKNNQIKKSDKKFIRREKANIRRQFLDVKKQEELITELYKKFSPIRITSESVVGKGEQNDIEVAVKKPEVKAKKIVKSEKPSSFAKAPLGKKVKIEKTIKK